MPPMRRISLPLAALLFATLGACATLPPPTPASAVDRGPGRLPGWARPLSYQVHLKVDPRQTHFKGESALKIQVEVPTDTLAFHSISATALSVEVEGPAGTIPAEITPDEEAIAAGDPGRHLIRLGRTATPGPYTLRFHWEAPFDEHLSGLYRAESEGRWYAYTQFEAADARRAFPSLDEPAYKVPFQLSLTVPAGFVAITNTPEAGRAEVEGGVRVDFAQTQPLPTYLIALAVGEFDVIAGPAHRTPLRGLTAKGKGALMSQSLELHKAMLDIQEAYFGIPYPYEKIDAVAVLEFAAGAMENVGLITYREELSLIDPQTSPSQQIQRVASVTAHELAHQWFGNLVTLDWWTDIWLNEAFATWMANRSMQTWRPEWSPDLASVSNRGWAFQTDSLPGARAVRQEVKSIADAEAAFDAITYTKGAAVLHMIERWLGEETFRAGIQSYLRDNAHGSATIDDLLAHLSKAAKQDVAAVLRPFVDQPGIPRVDAQLACDAEGASTLTFTRGRYGPLGLEMPPAKTPWKVPLCYLTASSEGAPTRSCMLLEDDTATVALDHCPAWVHPNAGEDGYYRWTVSGDTLPKIAAELRDPRARAGLLDQAWAMVEAGALSPSAYLGTVSAFAATADDRELGLALQGVGRLGKAWPTLSRSPAMATWLRATFEARAKALGWEAAEGESVHTGRLRSSLLANLGTVAKADWVVSGATERAKAWLADPSAVPPELASTVVTISAYNGKIDSATLFAALDGAKAPGRRVALLRGLGSLPAGAEIEAALKKVVSGGLRKQDTWSILGPALGRPETQDQAFDFIAANYDGLIDRLPAFFSGASAHLPRQIGNFCTPEGRDKAAAFFAAKAIPDSEKATEMGLDNANRCIALSAAGRADLEAFVASQAPAAGPTQ